MLRTRNAIAASLIAGGTGRMIGSADGVVEDVDSKLGTVASTDGIVGEKRTSKCDVEVLWKRVRYARRGLRTSCLRPPLAGPWPLTPMGTC